MKILSGVRIMRKISAQQMLVTTASTTDITAASCKLTAT